MSSRYRKTTRDEGEFVSVPAGRHLFPAVDSFAPRRLTTSGDTRIVGSNFVMAASRPDDLFFGKIDRLLAEARNINSWDVWFCF